MSAAGEITEVSGGFCPNAAQVCFVKTILGDYESAIHKDGLALIHSRIDELIKADIFEDGYLLRNNRKG